MPTDPAPPARELAAIIRDEIARTGAMPWARFMELALYQPEHGYYERATQNIGRRGDFFTSVSVGPLFGELLAAQFSEWLDELPPPPAGGPLQLVEAGAHNGQLAHDVLAWFQCQRPDQFAALEYCVLEPSPRRQAWQAEMLRAFAGKVRWFRGWEEMPVPGISGIIFSNELLDAFPVRRLGWDAAAAKWFEWAVRCDGDAFAWTRLPLTDNPRDLFHPLTLPRNSPRFSPTASPPRSALPPWRGGDKPPEHYAAANSSRSTTA